MKSYDGFVIFSTLFCFVLEIYYDICIDHTEIYLVFAFSQICRFYADKIIVIELLLKHTTNEGKKVQTVNMFTNNIVLAFKLIRNKTDLNS